MKIYDLSSSKENYFIIYKWIRCNPSTKWTLEEFNASKLFDIKSFGHLFIDTSERLLFDMFPFASIIFPKYYSDVPRLAKCQLILLLMSCFIAFNCFFTSQYSLIEISSFVKRDRNSLTITGKNLINFLNSFSKTLVKLELFQP